MSQPGAAVSGVVVSTSHVQRLAVAAYLPRFKGQSRVHTEADLPGYLAWCESHGLDPLAATRPHIELFVRGSKRSVATGPRRSRAACRWWPGSTAPASSTPYLSTPRPSTSAGPTFPPSPRPWDSSHLQFEALLITAKQSSNRCDFALVTMLGLLGLRIFEATGSNIEDLGEEHGHCVLRVMREGRRGRPGPTAARRGPRRGLSHRRPGHWPGPDDLVRHADGPPLRHPPATPTRRRCRSRAAADASHPNYILAAYMASGT